MTLSPYQKFLKRYAFNRSAFLKDVIKIKLASYLPASNYDGRILYYHYVFPENYDNFKMQIDYFSFVGFNHLGSNDNLFSITFDDTFKLNMPVYEYLRGKNIPVTLFISPRAVEEQKDIYHGSNLPQLDLSDLHRLIKIGVNIENHTFSHTKYSHAEAFLNDVVLAQNWIISNLGITPSRLAFPRGDELPFNDEEWCKLTDIGINQIYGTSRYTCKESRIIGRHHVMPHWPQKTLDYFFGL